MGRSLIHLLGLLGCIALGFVIGAASSGPQDMRQTSDRCSVLDRQGANQGSVGAVL